MLRPQIGVSIGTGTLGAVGVVAGLLALFDAVKHGDLSWPLVAPVVLLTGSLAFGLYYATMEVHASSERIWLRRFGMTMWSVPVPRAGTVEGKGEDWRLIFVRDLEKGRRVGSINWWVLDHRELARFSRFVDDVRIARGVPFDS